MTTTKKYTDYKATLQKHADIEHAIALLNWDKEVNLPPKGNNFRAQQIATLSGIAHEIISADSLGGLMEDLLASSNDLDEGQVRNVTLSHKEYLRQKSLSKEFVMRRSRAISETYYAWIKARKENDWNSYKDQLATMVDIKLEEAELVGYSDHPYDILMDEYEPGANVKDLDILFKEVREQLVAFANEIRSKQQVDDHFLYKHFPKDQQWDFGLYLLQNMGYDFEAGRQDISEHPFTTNFAPTDVRVTTRIDEKNFGNMTWSCIHEGGHALYEQGLPPEQYGLPLGKYLSLGIHESQSRLWENNVGRSLPYWKAHYEKLQKTFSEQLAQIPLDDFYKGINKITPSLIRTESDELHYHFHILIRYEIEKGLMDRSLKASDLKEIWNARYQEYLGISVTDDNSGILQDIHWSHGSIGYFPTYSLGSFYAAQFFHHAKIAIPNLTQQIELGDNSQLLQWLRTEIHGHGKFYSAEDLCKKITGEKLKFQYFMEYAREKYSGIY